MSTIFLQFIHIKILIMKRKSKTWLSAIPSIFKNNHLSPFTSTHWVKKRPRHMKLKTQVLTWDRLKMWRDYYLKVRNDMFDGCVYYIIQAFIYRWSHDIFHIGRGIIPRLSYISNTYFQLEEMRIYVKQNFNMNIFGKHF